MKIKNLFQQFALAALSALSLVVLAVFAQATLPAPKQEKLLNGLKVLMWSDPKADKVSIKLRIHSGAAFDPQGKEGTIQMLADALFPTEASHEYFTEDLGGNLEIIANYDYIQINASSKPEGLLTMLETISTAVINSPFDKETTAKLRAAQLTKIASLEADPSYIADQAVAKRLFGTFPYGRPQYGTAESVKKIEVGDLIDAKTRFLTADNATLALSGNFGTAAAFRAIRRYFGGWLKADKKIPATFRQPDDPDTKALKIELPGLQKPLSRSARLAPARVDKDYYSTVVFIHARAAQRCSDRYQAYLLKGIFMRNEYAGDDLPNYSGPCGLVGVDLQKPDMPLLPPLSKDEFDYAKAGVIAERQQRVEDLWLDIDTYKLGSDDDELRKLNGVTLADVKAAAERLYRSPGVYVSVSSKKPN